MTETPRTGDAQTGDTVEVVVKGEVLSTGTGGWMNVAVGAVPGQPQRGVISLPCSGEGVSVEVLERADDPALGEIRRVKPSLDGQPKTAVKVGASLSAMPSERFVWVVVETGEVLAADQIDVHEVIGAVPDTPAAEAAALLIRSQKPAGMSVHVVQDPLGLGERLWRDLNRYAGQGALNAAAGVLTLHTTMSGDEAVAYVKDMSEYQAWLNRHEPQEPRVFTADGPEPPLEVEVLEWLDFDPNDNEHRFLTRDGAGWRWSRTASVETDDDMYLRVWPPTSGRFQEVLS